MKEKECPVCGKSFIGRGKCCSQKCYQHYYYISTIDKRKEYKKKYRKEHREEILEKRRKYYEENKELMKEKRKKYYKEHLKQSEKEKIRRKKYYQMHKEDVLERSRKWRKENVEKAREYCKRQYWENKIKGLTRIEVDGKLKWVERPKLYCIECGNEISDAKKRNAKYCNECRKQRAREKYKEIYKNYSDEKKKELARKANEYYHKKIASMTPEQLEEYRKKDSERVRKRYWKKKGIEI